MGMFDELQCKYPLPVAGANDWLFQTKGTPRQFMDLYEIREDGTLWHQEYDIEDHSDKNAEPGSLESIVGCMTRVNKRWAQMVGYIGEIRFYTFPNNDSHCEGWVEFSAYFNLGQLTSLSLIEYREGSKISPTESLSNTSLASRDPLRVKVNGSASF